MRIWSVHPKYLDAKGIVALWRETLLAKNVLEGNTKGYKNHPQLTRFKAIEKPLEAINQYLAEGILPVDPFQTLDESGVGELIKIAVEKTRQVKPKMKIGVCGELGGDPKSIEFFDQLGLDYVSCSPYRVPVAYLAAAQSGIRMKK